MKEFITYSIYIIILYMYSGIGLTFLLCPKNFEKYSVYLSPFVGLSYLSYIGWFFYHYGTGGTDVYSRILLLPPIFFLIIGILIKKERISELYWPFQKENLMLIVITIIVFFVVSCPYLLRVDGLNAITLSNPDIANYAVNSKYMTKSSLSQPPIFYIENDRFAAFVSTAIPSSIFSIEPYKLQNILIFIFFSFSVPIVFLAGLEIFKYKKSMAMLVAILCGISYHLLYINYMGFLGQVIGMGMFLSFFVIILYPILNCDKLFCFKSYIPLAIILGFGSIASYVPLLPLFFIPIFGYLFLDLISTKSISKFSNALGFLLLTLFIIFVISPILFIYQIKQLLFFATIGAVGWNPAILSPDSVFGLGFVGNNIFMQQSNPIIDRFLLSIPIIFFFMISFVHLFRKERQIFYLSISYVFFICSLYAYLIINEVFSPSFTGEGYKAYKLITYFIPIILLSGLSYFKNFHIPSITKITKHQVLSTMFLVLIITGNIWSASEMMIMSYDTLTPIKESIIDLQKIVRMNNVSSINIIENYWWDQMWMYYFLFMDTKLYLQTRTYYAASPLLGEWTLQKSGINYFKMRIRFPSNLSGSQEPLITAGKTGAGDFVFVRYISDGKIAFKFNHWGVGESPESMPILVESERFYPLEIVLDNSQNMVIINFDSQQVLRYNSILYSTANEDITIGQNRIYGTGPGPHFSGEIQDLEKKTVVIDDIITHSYIDQNIIEVNKDYYLIKNNMEVRFGKGWYGIESNQYGKWRWNGKNNETTALELDVRKQNISMDLQLNYWPLDTNNNFSIFLDGNYIKDCEDNRLCLIKDIVISKGKHEMLFKTKLPPILPGNGDTRKLSYAFSNIVITVNNIR